MNVSLALLHSSIELADDRCSACENEAVALLSGCLSLSASGTSAERYRDPLRRLIDAVNNELTCLKKLGAFKGDSVTEADIDDLQGRMLRLVKDLISSLPSYLPAALGSVDARRAGLSSLNVPTCF